MSTTRHFGRTDSRVNVRLSPSFAVLPYRRGMHPPPQDAKKVYRELIRLSWQLHCLGNERAKLVCVVARYEQKINGLRREHDSYANALQDLDPELFERAEERRRDYDNPRKAIEWAVGRPEGGDS